MVKIMPNIIDFFTIDIIKKNHSYILLKILKYQFKVIKFLNINSGISIILYKFVVNSYKHIGFMNWTDTINFLIIINFYYLKFNESKNLYVFPTNSYTIIEIH